MLIVKVRNWSCRFSACLLLSPKAWFLVFLFCCFVFVFHQLPIFTICILTQTTLSSVLVGFWFVGNLETALRLGFLDLWFWGVLTKNPSPVLWNPLKCVCWGDAPQGLPGTEGSKDAKAGHSVRQGMPLQRTVVWGYPMACWAFL